MFGQLDLSPMVVVLLLLYGLLLAVCLVVWTALDLGGGKKDAASAQSQRAAPGNAEAERPLTARQPSGTEPARPEQPRPAQAALVPESRRRAADSESVVSYSVRPRVNQAENQPRVAAPPAAARPDPIPEPAPRPVAPATASRVASEPEPSTLFEVGRDSRKPRDPGSRAGTIMPGQRGNKESGARLQPKGEDAFERFLRSSRDDGDDY